MKYPCLNDEPPDDNVVKHFMEDKVTKRSSILHFMSIFTVLFQFTEWSKIDIDRLKLISRSITFSYWSYIKLTHSDSCIQTSKLLIDIDYPIDIVPPLQNLHIVQ